MSADDIWKNQNVFISLEIYLWQLFDENLNLAFMLSMLR